MLNDQELDKYPGTYISDRPPIKVICTKNNGNLSLETQGHHFALDAIDRDKFMNRQFGFFFTFQPADKQLVITENGDIMYYLSKQ